MAHGTLTYMRLMEGDDALTACKLVNPALAQIMFEKSQNGKRIQILIIRYTGTFSNGYAEIGAPNAVFDGTTTAAVVYIDSSSAVDSSAGAGVQEVTVIGVLEAGYLGTVATATGGLTGQSSVSKFQRIFHAYTSAAGANNDAEGDIYIQDDVAGTTKYLKMAAGSVETEGSAIFIPAGYSFSLAEEYLVMTTAANATSAVLTKCSATNVGSIGADPDLAYRPIRATSNSAGQVGHPSPIHSAAVEGKLTFSETYAGAVEDGYFEAYIAIMED